MRKLLATKLQRLTYLVVLMWVILGCVCITYERSFTDLAVYFVSLSGFAGTYVFGEIKRPSSETALFLSGSTSSREKMMYWIVVLWFFLGIIGVVQNLALQEMGAYFASLTPFVSAFIIGQTYKPEIAIIKEPVIPEEEEADDQPPAGTDIKPPDEENK